MKDKKLEREEYITSLIEVTVQGGWLTDIYASIEAFGFVMDVLGSTIRPTIVKNLAVTILQRIMTPLFVSLYMFALVVPYLFYVLLITIMTS